MFRIVAFAAIKAFRGEFSRFKYFNFLVAAVIVVKLAFTLIKLAVTSVKLT